jgi:hypothetical protein
LWHFYLFVRLIPTTIVFVDPSFELSLRNCSCCAEREGFRGGGEIKIFTRCW